MRRFLLPLLLLALVGITPPRAMADAPTSPDALQIDPFCGVPRLGIAGEPGAFYTIESAPSLLPGTPWSPVLDLAITTPGASWCDTEAQGTVRRFYRAIRLSAPPPEVRPRNFRLTDHTGHSRELYYAFSDETLTGYVLIFTGNTCSNLIPELPALKLLSDRYAPKGVQFWIVSSLFGTSRSNLIAEASALHIPYPILHDGAQLVTRDFGVTQVPEVVLIQNWTFQLMYRGPVQESTSGGRQEYLASAIDSMLAQAPVTLTRVRPLGPPSDLIARPTPDWARDVAPILQNRCIRCHSPGNIGPWSMTNYAAVKFVAEAIKDEVLSQRMPPWHADPHVGKFANDSSLRPEEAATLIAWVDGGAPRGTGPDPLDVPLTEAPAWPLGTPDIILSIPNQALPASGDIDYRYLTVDPALSADIWLKAAVVRPGNRKVVHHALVFQGTAAQALGGLSGYFAGYVPGLDPTFFPDGTGKLLAKGTKLTFQMHYVSVGTAQTDQTQLGLYLLPKAPTRSLQTKAAYDIAFSIPPRTNGYQTVATALFAKNSWLYEISPHQHLRGTWFHYDLQLPNGTRQPIIHIPHYLFSWQRLYRLDQPIQVPAGSRIVCTGAWDNTPQNLSNPNPDTTVFFGEQTYEEMFIGYYNYAEGP
ncbi:MAG TPA: hypothetical protein DCM86_17555 [Verrucomicrobiales bacterium]|nr:hypothetical protein [Verrucomicrobiales bacterium]